MEATTAHGVQAIAGKARVLRRHLRDILAGRKMPPDTMAARLARVAYGLAAAQPKAEDVRPAIEQRCQGLGRRRFARLAGFNDGHLGRIISGVHGPSGATLAKLA